MSQILSVCEADHATASGHGCIDFGLTMQASSRDEAESIKLELGQYIATSSSLWRELLRELSGENVEVDDPDIIGTSISPTMDQIWYPAWNSGSDLCSNDANVPFYMRLDPEEYLAPTMTDCCRKHYWWNVRGCAEPQNRPCPEGYNPADPEIVKAQGLMNGKYFGKYPNIFYSGW